MGHPKKGTKRSVKSNNNNASTSSEETDREMQSYKRLKRNKTKLKSYKLSSSESEDEVKVKPKSKKAVDYALTVEQIKAEWKKQDENRKKTKELLELAKVWEKQMKEDEIKEKEYQRKKEEEEERKRNFVMKDCKHLSLAQLDRRFKKDFKWIDGVFHGKIYSERHERFKVDDPKNRLTAKDLMYNVSCEVFTEEQQIHIVGLFRNKYDKGSLFRHVDYYWKVLLPEYCLKIFMDIYKMEHDKAMDYLNTIPVPIERYFKTPVQS